MNSAIYYTKDDKRILFFVALVWGVDLLYYLKAIVMRLPVVKLLANYFVPSVIIITLLLTFKSLNKKFRPSDFIFFFGCVIVYLMTYLFFPANDQYLTQFLPLVLFQILPFFFVGILIEPQKHLKVLEYVSMAYIVLSFIYLYMTFATRDVEGEEMGFAYSLLPHLLIVLNSCFRHFKWYSLLIFVLGFARLMGTGNRGSLLCVAFFVVCYLIFCTKLKHKIPFATVLVLVVVYFGINQDMFLGHISDFLGGYGFNTRVFDMALNDEFSDANGREELFSFFTNKISTGGILGYGILGDRILMNMENGYPHNLALELLVDFGIPLGSLFIISIAAVIYLAFRTGKDRDDKSLLIIFVTVGIFSLFLSNSYLSNPMFFLAIGYCVNMIRRNKTTLKKKETLFTNENTVSQH